MYTTKSSKFNFASRKINLQNIEIKVLNILDYIFSKSETLIHSIWISDVKAMNNLVFWAI